MAPATTANGSFLVGIETPVKDRKLSPSIFTSTGYGKSRKIEEDAETLHNYPFLSMLKMSIQETNPSPVRLSIKRPSDFTNPKRLDVIKLKATRVDQLKPLREQTKGYF